MRKNYVTQQRFKAYFVRVKQTDTHAVCTESALNSAVLNRESSKLTHVHFKI